MRTASSTSSTRSLRDAVEPRVVAEVLAPAQVAVQQRLVRQESELAADRERPPRQLLAEQRDLPGVRAQQRRQDPQERRLAGAVAPEHGERRARGNA